SWAGVMIIGFNTQIMPEMAARTLCRSARLRTQFCGVLQKAPRERFRTSRRARSRCSDYWERGIPYMSLTVSNRWR
ncbi:MAG: hypothetical protein LBP86_03175, partial [Azoarcus sp.]|nr:hypothetical protein [Azoarcus sp.]